MMKNPKVNPENTGYSKSRENSMSRRGIILLALIMIASSILTAACNKNNKKDEAKEEEGGPLSVKVGYVIQGDVETSLNLVGNVLPKYQAIITSQVPGKVKTIYHRDGEWVRKNAKLVRIDPEYVDRGVKQAQAALAAAYATLSQARIQRDTMEIDLERLKQLYERGAISAEQMEKAEAGFKAAEASVRMAGAGVSQAKAVLGDARSYRRETTIRAPFEGEVAKLLLEEGERIQTMPPTPVMVLMNYDTVEVECQVTEREVGAISEGMSVTVVLDAFPHSTIEASVTRVVPVLDPMTRTFTIKVELPNADHKIKPGMMARVKIRVVYKNIVSISRDAVSLNNITGERRIVEVVDSKAVERYAEMGRNFGDRIELTDLGGLEVGSSVITSGASGIFTGRAVQVVETEEER